MAAMPSARSCFAMAVFPVLMGGAVTTALLLMVLGATLAMWLREGMPLTIYLWAFLPSIADLILISSGDHVMRDGNVAGGFAVMWAGNAVLVVLILAAYRNLARH